MHQLRIAFALLVSLLSQGVGQTLAADRPNVVFIMSDDHAAQAVGVYGSRLAELDPTPNIDRLAKQGMRFNNAFATNSICTPSRATLLTGQYSHINGVPVFNPIDRNRPVFTTELQKAGYYTAIVGKWHLGSDPVGFDDWEIFPGQGAYWNPKLYGDKSDHKYEGHATEVVTKRAIERLEARPKDKPFFLMVHHKAPHRNWQPAPKHAEKYKDKTIPLPENLLDDYATRTDAIRKQHQSIARDLNRNDLKQDPPADLKGDDLVRWKYERYMRDYLACVQGVDDSVGEIADWLDKHGLGENTLIIYTSDQGFFLGEHGLYDKRFMYEESLRMPLVMRWPSVIKPESICDELVINCDFAPTFLNVAGLPASPEMQGTSLLPLMKGEHPESWRNAFYYRYYHDPGDHNTRAHYGIRTKTHKLIYFWKLDQWECFDLVKDPNEMHNLCADPGSAETVNVLKARLQELKKEVRDDDQFADKLPGRSVNERSK